MFNVILEKTKAYLLKTIQDEELFRLHKYYSSKVSFIPIESRIYGAIVHSLITQQGQCIEDILRECIKSDNHFIVHPCSGVNKYKFQYSQLSEDYINNYISLISRGNRDVDIFNQLLDDIIDIEQEERLDIEFHNMNCDLLFQDTKSELWFCYEIKFQDGRDSFTQQGYLKKLLLLYAGIIHEVKSNKIIPQLYYFLPPGNKNLYNYLYFNHDSQFFTFHQLETSYQDILLDLRNVQVHKEVIDLLEQLKEKIRRIGVNL